jgi:transposase
VERIAMSTKEAQRGVVLAQVAAGRLPLTAAAAQLGVSYRQAKRLYGRYKAHGRAGLRHGHVGRRSNRARAAEEQAGILELVRTHYGGSAARGAGQRFGPTLAAEHLARDHGVVVAVPTLRRWMLAAGLWSRQRRARPPHVRRARRAAFGELLQLDGSFHDWFEGREPALAEPGRLPCLLTLVDDATGRTRSHFAAQETTWAAAGLLRAWIEAHGVPRALYVDAKSVYVRQPTSQELAAGIAPLTQFGRMCAVLGIEMIVAGSPEAKGRVERNHGTHQDRLIKAMRLAGISDLAAATAYLATYLPAHNARFAVAPQVGVDAHLPLAAVLGRRPLADVFSLETVRQLGRDWVVRYQNQGLQVTPSRAAQRHVAPRRRVLVRESATGTLTVVVVSPVDGREQVLAWTPVAVQGGAPAVVVPQPAPARPTSIAEPAGYTRAGKPLSTAQLAVRERWARQTTAERNRREGQRQWTEARRAARTAAASP